MNHIVAHQLRRTLVAPTAQLHGLVSAGYWAAVDLNVIGAVWLEFRQYERFIGFHVENQSCFESMSSYCRLGVEKLMNQVS